MRQPSLVEWHDARVAEVRVAGAKVVVDFEHLVVFFEKSAEKYAVEGWRGRLDCTMDGMATVQWNRQAGARVADGWVKNAAGQEVDADALLRGVDGADVTFQMEGGSNLAVNRARVVLTLLGKVSDLEEWEGPLR